MNFTILNLNSKHKIKCSKNLRTPYFFCSVEKINDSRKTKKNEAFPFVRFVGQDELKTALCLVAIDINIGGVIIMGDRGTGKSMLVRSIADILPDLDVVPGDPFNSSPTDVSLMGPDV